MITRSYSKVFDIAIKPHYLVCIPDELFVHILSFLPMSDIGNLSLTGSYLLRDKVIAWIKSIYCHKQATITLSSDIGDHEQQYQEWVGVCRQFGLLCKKASVLCSTSLSLSLLFSNFAGIDSLVCRGMDCVWAKIWGTLGIGAAVTSFLQGWDVKDYNKLDSWMRKLNLGLNSEDNRRILRILFLEFSSCETTKASWLIHILKTYTYPSFTMPVEQQTAKLIYILYGPALENLPPNVKDFTTFQLELYQKVLVEPNWTIMKEWFPTSYIQRLLLCSLTLATLCY